MNEVPHPEERRVRRVSMDEASWLKTAQERLLTMRSNVGPIREGFKKKARLKRALNYHQLIN
jgi:hypothetical protein